MKSKHFSAVGNFVPENYVHLSQDEKLNVIGCKYMSDRNVKIFKSVNIIKLSIKSLVLQHQSIANQAKLSVRLDMIEGAKKKKI